VQAEGLVSATEAINLFYRQARLNKGMTFDVRRAGSDKQRGLKANDSSFVCNTHFQNSRDSIK
jgi:hypothetical protein